MDGLKFKHVRIGSLVDGSEMGDGRSGSTGARKDGRECLGHRVRWMGFGVGLDRLRWGSDRFGWFGRDRMVEVDLDGRFCIFCGAA